MYRIDTATAVPVIPAPGLPGTGGYFQDGDSETGAQPTQLSAAFFNSIQEELMSILAAAGIEQNKAAYNQVLTAIQQFIAAETTRAEAAETANANAITAERTRAEAAETVNANAIAAETTRAEAAETANANAITAETTRAEAAETTISNTLAADIAALGTAAYKATTNNADAKVVASGSFTNGNLYAANANGDAVDSGVTVRKLYQATGITPTPGSSFSAAHGLGARPPNGDYTIIVQLRCLTAQAGYAVGDEAVMPIGGSGGATPAFTAWVNDTNVGVDFESTIYVAIVQRGGGGAVNITPADWEINILLRYY